MFAQQETLFRQGKIVHQQAERRGDMRVMAEQLQGFRQGELLGG